MSLDTIGLLIDFGLVVLIWMIQIVVYPSFLYYNSENLVRWHQKYTQNFSPIVIPLMFGQLGISLYQLIVSTRLYSLVHFIIVVLLWVSTFVQFVPIHTTIAKGKVNEKILISLVRKNWIRTALWTFLFLFSFLKEL
jgi:hypothetical protein